MTDTCPRVSCPGRRPGPAAGPVPTSPFPGQHGARTARLAVLLLMVLPFATVAQEAAEDDIFAPVPMWSLPEAETLRRGMLDAMPGVPLRIQARLRAKGASGRIETKAKAEVQWLPGADHLQADYRVTDAFGGDEERLEIRRPRDSARLPTPPEQGSGQRPARVTMYSGEPTVRVSDPDLYARIRETDLTWMDLSLSFLWWTGGKTVDREKVRGHTCWVVNTPAPAGEAGHAYSRVRMWIDAKVLMLLKAEAFDHEGNMVRRLLVDSFKKIDEVWFIKDIDVYSFPSRHKTTLRVDSVDVIGGAEAPPEEGGEG